MNVTHLCQCTSRPSRIHTKTTFIVVHISVVVVVVVTGIILRPPSRCVRDQYHHHHPLGRPSSSAFAVVVIPNPIVGVRKMTSSSSSSHHHPKGLNITTPTTTTTTTTTKLTNTTTTTTLSSEAQERLVYGTDDALFGYIEKQQRTAFAHTNVTDDDTKYDQRMEDDPPVETTTNNNTEALTTTTTSTTTSHFGHVLDAGTGLHSLRWLASLAHTQRLSSITAITADTHMLRNCQNERNLLGITHLSTILYGNWFSSSSSSSSSTSTRNDEDAPSTIVQQLQNPTTTCNKPYPTKFNVILADYLIGAMDGFVPYQQDLMIPQLLSLLAPKGRLYIVGLEPIPDSIDDTTLTEEEAMNQYSYKNDRDAKNLICRVRQTRDACILLAGQRCYREYPMEWILRQVEIYNHNTNNHDTKVRLVQSKQFPILYRHTTIMKQINVGRSKIPYLPIFLRDSMQQLWNDFENESKRYTSESPTGRIQFGFDYVVVIERTS